MTRECVVGATDCRGGKMKEWVAVLRAADAAAEEPYINHLLEVASLVAEATQGKNPKVVIAALLHDAIEDQEVPRELIAREFGEDVAALVEEVSDDKAPEKHHRKRIQAETAHNKSDDAKLIKLADKTSNLRAITFSARLVGQEETGIYQLGKTGCLGIA